MVTLEISPQGQITLPSEVLQSHTWKNNSELVMLRLGDAVILRPAHSQKTDEFDDLGGFFKYKGSPLSTTVLCEPLNLDS